MKSRIFISISIPEKDKKRIVLASEKWKNLPVRWMKQENLHITLVFLGLLDEKVISEICDKLKNATEKFNIFDLEFDQIELFPSIEEPRLIALTGKANDELKDLVNLIESELGISNASKKSFRPHITLGRIRKYKWEVLDNSPIINEKFSLNIPVDSIEILSSELDENGSNYTILESCALK